MTTFAGCATFYHFSSQKHQNWSQIVDNPSNWRDEMPLKQKKWKKKTTKSGRKWQLVVKNGTFGLELGTITTKCYNF